jgi:hypothetical protein
MNIIERIEILIELECISSNAFALKVGVDPRNLSRMLADKQTITDRTLRKIVDAIGCTFEWLKYGEGEMFPAGSPKNAATINSNNENSNINDSDTINRLLALLEEKDKQINQLLQVISNLSK